MTQPRVALINLEVGEAGTIDHISLPPADQQFLKRIGFVPGAEIRFSRRAPLGDPSVYSVTEPKLRCGRRSRAASSFSGIVFRDWVTCRDGYSD